MKTVWAFLLMSISLLSNAQTKINPARLLQGTSGSGSVFLKSDNSGNVSFSNNLNGGVLSGLGNGVLSSDAVNLGQLQGSVNGTLNYIPKFTAANSIGNSNLTDDGATLTYYHGTSNDNSFTLYPSDYTTQATGIFFRTATNAVLRMVDGANFRIKHQSGDRLLINSSGNVGIGTSSPSQKLHVAGSIRVDNYIFGYNNRGIFGSDAGGSYLGSLGGSTSTLPTYVAAENAPIRFHNNSVERMRITEAGNVGIGTVSPQYKLDVNGTVGIRSDLNILTTNTQIIGGFGAGVSSGAPDWNDVSNARSGNGYTLLLGSATNGTGLEPSTYYHPFSFEYNSRNGSGNMTQFAIPYTVGNNSGKLHFRARYSGVWSDWQRIPTQAQIDADYGKLIGINNWTGSNNTFVGITANTVQANYNIIAKGTLQGYSGAGIFMSYETYGGRFESYDYSTGSWKNIAISPNGGNVGIGRTSPSFKLDVAGSMRVSSTDFGQLLLDKYNTVNDNYVYYLTQGTRTGYSGINAAGNFFISTDGVNASVILSPNGTGVVDVSSKRISNIANATNANDAVNLSQAQNASNLTTGTIPDARISTNIARVADLKLCNYTALTLPTQSTDYTLNFNWDNYAQNTYGVDGTGFSGTNILISGSNPKTGGFYNVIITNCGGRNLVFSSKFKNFDGVALSTINATSAMRFKFVFNGTDYMRID